MPYREIEILLVEDNPNDAELIIRALNKNLISADKILHVSNGSSAIEFFFEKGDEENRNASARPKVVLLDIKMPLIGGFEVLKRIKENEQTKQIPVIMLTSSKENQDIMKAYALGVNSYVVKPVGFESFYTTIAEICSYWLLLNHLQNDRI